MLLNIAMLILGFLGGAVLVFFLHGSILADLQRGISAIVTALDAIKAKLGA